jgi:hypothetical protein
MAGELGRALQRGLPATNPSNALTTQPQQAQPRTPVEKSDRPEASSRPQREDRIRFVFTHPRIPRRWIEAQHAPPLRDHTRTVSSTSCITSAHTYTLL